MRIIVTGGSGRAGVYVIPELLEHGYEVVNVDRLLGEVKVPIMRADLTDYGQTVSALRGAEGVIHLAAIPNPNRDTPEVVFSTNVVTTWNILQAADVLGIKKLVLASSINAIGADFSQDVVPPLYFPVDEEHPTRAEDSYSLSKWVGEQIADGFARTRKAQIASLRFHGIRRDEDIQTFKTNPVTDPFDGDRMLWGYLTFKEAARACRMALEAEWQGHEVFFINSKDTRLSIPTEQAIATCFPGVPLRQPLPGHQSAIDCSKAKRMFGWETINSWRELSE